MNPTRPSLPSPSARPTRHLRRRLPLGLIALGTLGIPLVPACGSHPAPSRENTGATSQAWGPPVTQITGVGGNYHEEVAAGISTILTSNSGNIEFFNRSDGSKIDAGCGTGTVLPASSLFGSFFPASSPNFINANLPQPPPPYLPPPNWATCDKTVDAWSNGNGSPAFVDACFGNFTYDTHSDYDSAHKRFIIATHLRNNNWTYPTSGSYQGQVWPNPGLSNSQDPTISDPFSWRVVIFAVSVSENPADGFYLYEAPEYYGDWPRVGVSGDFYVVADRSEGSGWEYDSNHPFISLYNLDDLANGYGAVGFAKGSAVEDGGTPYCKYNPPPTGTLHSYSYAPAELSGPWTRQDFVNAAVDFLVVPAHEEPPDANGSLTGTAYVMAGSSHGEVPNLYGFVPNLTDPTAKPVVMSYPMPDGTQANIPSYGGVIPTSATIRVGLLYSTYEDNQNNPRLDCQQIATTHSLTSAPALTLTPSWGILAPPGSSTFVRTAPLVEATADGSAVFAYSAMNTPPPPLGSTTPANQTLDVRSETVSSSGIVTAAEQIWATGPYQAPITTNWGNRQSVDPGNPLAVWILGSKGIAATAKNDDGSINDVEVTQQVFVNGSVNPYDWCSVGYSCYGYSGAATITCGQGLNGLSLLRREPGCTSCSFEPVGNAVVGQVTNAWVDYLDNNPPAPGTTLTYEVAAEDVNGETSLSAPLTTTTIDCSCHPEAYCTNQGVEGGVQCGTVPDGCGGYDNCGSCKGVDICSSGYCCPPGTTYNSNFNACTKIGGGGGGGGAGCARTHSCF